MTDEQLMQAVCDGDRGAYRELVNRHLKSISHYCYRLLGNTRDTEDITQEAFLKLWLNANSWRADKARLSTWLHRIAHNLCVDHMRKHGRVQLSETIEELSDDQRASDLNGSATLDAPIEEDRKQRLLKQALDQLPESQRTALILCHYQNFSNKEAAAIVSLSVKALESAIARAKRSLKQLVLELSEQSETTASSLTQDSNNNTKYEAPARTD